jgi:hypothetical protein
LDPKLLARAIKQRQKILPMPHWDSFRDPIGTTAFVVLQVGEGYSAKTLKGLEIAGIVYAHDDNVPPLAIWTGCLVQCHAMNKIYMVLGRGVVEGLTIAVFAVDPKAKAGQFPLELPLDFDQWPKPLPAVSEKIIHASGRELATFGPIDVISDEKTLLISAPGPPGRRRFYQLDLEHKTWTTAEVVKGKSLK